MILRWRWHLWMGLQPRQHRQGVLLQVRLLRPRHRVQRFSRLVLGRLVFRLSRCSLDLGLGLGRRSRSRRMEKGLAPGIFPGRLIRQVEV